MCACLCVNASDLTPLRIFVFVYINSSTAHVLYVQVFLTNLRMELQLRKWFTDAAFIML